jgi:hypothetical protein
MANPPKLTPAANAAVAHLDKIKRDAEEAMLDEPSIPIDVRQLLLHASGQEKLTFMEPAKVYDGCIVGTAETNGEIVVVYNKTAVIVATAKLHDITFEQAFDAFTTQWLKQRAKPLVDADGMQLPQTPIFMVDLRDFVL